MSRNWESSFESWAQPPSRTAQEKAENAERAIRTAISEGAALGNRNVSVFPQGSYKNRTNIGTESDVDIAVRSRATFFFELPEGMTAGDFSISTPAEYSYPQYRQDVYQALIDHLGRGAITKGGKAFDIHENSYRVDADALACFEYRRYWSDGSYREGFGFVPQGGSMVFNYPEQSYANGVSKNRATNRRFKALVRIIKFLRSEMASNNVAIAKNIPSFLIECLIWNVPNEGFGHETYTADVRYVLAHLCNETRADADCSDWKEVNGFKFLFHSSQPWTRSNANSFLNSAWNYVGFV